MKKLIFILMLTMTALAQNPPLPPISAPSLTDPEALAKAQSIWGPKAGYINKSQSWSWWSFRNITYYKVGCVTTDKKVVIVGRDQIDWNHAFAKVDMNKNGQRMISANGRTFDGSIVTSDLVRIWICNP